MSSQKQQPAKLSKLDQLREREQRAEEGGGEARVEKQHAAGKMTARERIDFLLDENTFQEFDKLVVHRSRDFGRSEEHTSELQSQSNLVCRLLLEKKKKSKIQ